VQSSTVREILVIRSRRALSADDPQHLVDIAGATDNGLVFPDDHELYVAQRSKVAFPQVSLQFAIGNAAKPSQPGIVIEVESGEAVVLDQNTGGQMAKTAADNRRVQLPRADLLGNTNGIIDEAKSGFKPDKRPAAAASDGAMAPRPCCRRDREGRSKLPMARNDAFS